MDYLILLKGAELIALHSLSFIRNMIQIPGSVDHGLLLQHSWICIKGTVCDVCAEYTDLFLGTPDNGVRQKSIGYISLRLGR
ncbi:hypothetical protein NDU88_001282 [Pleurodeles waltl]|uniref:Uncharacterized protein n=1 Tax=Pleurodeles waltl TaxID=8319 RepID=A0AAV7KQJ4_PLEWA|nr:hypothetical protein NDU88_001282 [Pleurodeles waltl]